MLRFILSRGSRCRPVLALALALVAVSACSAVEGEARDASAEARLDGASEGGALGPRDASADGGDEACDGVPRGFACEGDTWALCDLGEPWRVDCRMPPRGASPGRCSLISPEHGHACVVAAGGGCRMEVAHGTHAHVFITACEGTNGGCLITERGSGFEGTCVADLGACTVDDVDVCRGQRLITRCLRGQPVATDCAALGGRCGPGLCVDLPVGAPCGSTLRCRDGLGCVRPSRRELYRCAVEGDAGVADAR
jgi:hypothetical protein